MKTLLVLRHAKSSWDDESLDDHERPLNKRGSRDAPRMGDWMREHGLMPDAIISSTAARARLTAEAAAEALGYAKQIDFDDRLYLASAHAIIDVVQTVAPASAGTVLLVGHNPGLEELVAVLTGEHHDMPTAALAHIALPIERWRDLDAAARGTLIELTRPKEL